MKSLIGDIDEEEEFSVMVKSYGDLLGGESERPEKRRDQLDFDGRTASRQAMGDGTAM